MDDKMYLRKGTLLNNQSYRIERVLGQGGFGITYLAVHTRLNKQVAIKEFFPKSFCGRDNSEDELKTVSNSNVVTVEKLKSKFIKEAEHIARMDSPYIVRIQDVFEENKTAYYIMDYIEGPSLSDKVKSDGPLLEKKAIEYILKIGEALTYIHSKRINHLDVKPANIMLRATDDSPILVDFGLSKQYDSEGNQTSTTPIGLSHGYAPMEQYKAGGVREFSPKTDLYSLAATLYYLLTGVTPPEAPSLADEKLTFPAGISYQLIPVIEQAMSTKRSDRQESVEIFCKQLLSYNNSDGNNTQFASEQNNNKTERKQKPNGKLYAAEESCAERRNLESKSKEELKAYSKKNIKKALGYFSIAIVALLCLYALRNCDSRDNKTSSTNNVEEVDSLVAVEEVVSTEIDEQQGAPFSEGEKKDGLGGFDNNANGYFNMFADTYLTSNRDVYFDGFFIDSKGKYPISLKFEIDDNWFPGICYYHNIDYDVKLKMSVRFTEEQMIITGNAGGSYFTINLAPTVDGKWKGTAQNGNHKLEANIWPVKR